MTRTRKKGDGRGLAGGLKGIFEKIQLEAEIAEILASPKVSDHDKAILRAIIHGSISFKRAVEVIAASPLVESLKDIGPEIMVEAGLDSTLPFQASIIELYELVHTNTREAADMSRLITAAATDAEAFDICMALFHMEICRPGMPNSGLRRWFCERPKRPPAKRRQKPKMRWRNAAIIKLIDDAAVLGFAPSKSSASTQSGCEVVQAALREAKLPAPTVKALEQIWKQRQQLAP